MEAATAPPETTHDAPPLDGKAQELEGEAGEAVGAMPANPPQNDPVEIQVGGTAQLELFDLGGKRPTSSKLRLAGGSVDVIDGQAFRKGDVIRFSGTAVISAVTQQDKRDAQTQQVVSCEQKHIGLITDLRLEGSSE